MYDPVADRSLSQFFSHQSGLVSEQFHRQLVVGHLKEGDDLVLEVVGRRQCRGARRLYEGPRWGRRELFLEPFFRRRRRRRRLVFRGAVGQRRGRHLDGVVVDSRK